VAIFGLGAIGQACLRVARYLGLELVIGVDHVPERLAMAGDHDAAVVNSGRVRDVAGAIAHLTDGAGVDGVIDAVGMEAEATILDHLMQTTTQEPSRMLALRAAIESVRRGGTIAIAGLYADPIHSFPIDRVFD
jgi:threonine dehydrogenase-like Zn-dependent dehydrogenase